jgi:hypothetical protein
MVYEGYIKTEWGDAMTQWVYDTWQSSGTAPSAGMYEGF